MKKITILLSSMFLLAGCIESVALLGPATGATNGKIVQSSLKSAVSFGVKKTTGKTPIGHALAFSEKKNPNKKKERCISFIEKTNSEACMIINKQITLTRAAVDKKLSSTQDTVVKKIYSTQALIKKKVILEKTVKAENKNDHLIKAKKSAREFVSLVRSKIKEYDTRWLNRIERSQVKYSN